MSQVAPPQQQKPSNMSLHLEGHLRLMQPHLLNTMHQVVWSHERICDYQNCNIPHGDFGSADPAVRHLVSLACLPRRFSRRCLKQGSYMFCKEQLWSLPFSIDIMTLNVACQAEGAWTCNIPEML